MLDPFSPLFQSHPAPPATVAVDMLPGASSPASEQGLMIAGIVILVVTAFWVFGALGAAVSVRLDRLRDRGFRSPDAGR
jgi:hypothetical protein